MHGLSHRGSGALRAKLKQGVLCTSLQQARRAYVDKEDLEHE